MAVAVVSPVLIGRSVELERLEGALERIRAGRPAVIFVAGEAGAGKSRLVSELAERSSSCGASFLVGGCIPLGRGELPFAPVLEALRSVDPAVLREVAGVDAQKLARLLPEVARWDDQAAPEPHGAQSGLLELLSDVLARLSRDGPVVLVLEDLHWADRSTLELVGFLVRNLRREAVALVATYRHDELHRDHPLRSWLAELRRFEMVETIELAPLNREQTTEQLHAILGLAPAPAVVDVIYERGEGNPFFTEELLVAVRAEGVAALPAALVDVPLTKVHALAGPTQDVLRLVATAGRRVSHDLLCAIKQVEEEELDRGLREAVDRQVIVADADDESYSFRHGLIQEAVYAEVLPGERRRLHAALAQALTASPELSPRGATTAVAEVAHHWYAAKDRPRALKAAVEAATAAENVYAYAEALGHLSRALSLWDCVPEADLLAHMDRVTLHERAAQAAGLIGEYQRAAALVSDAIELLDEEADRERAGLLYEQLGMYHMSDGEQMRAEEAFNRAMDLLPVDPPSNGRGRALIGAAQLAMLCSRYDDAERLASDALTVARQVGQASTEARTLGTLGVVASHRGETGAAEVWMRQGIAIARDADDAATLASLYINFGHVLGLASYLDEAVAVSIEGYELVRRLGLGRQAGTYLKCNQAWALFKLGRWEEAAGLWREASAGGMRGIREVSLLLACAEFDIAQGRFESARQRLDRAVSLTGRAWAPLFYQRELAEQRAELAVWEGDLDQARTVVFEGIELLSGTDDERFGGRLILLGLRAEADRLSAARTSRGRGQAADAARLTEQLLDAARSFRPSPLEPTEPGLPETAAMAAGLHAECSRARGNSSPQLWAVTAARWEELHRPYPAAYARWRQAEALIATGDRAQAAEVLRAALAVAHQLEATPLAAGIEELARRARMRVSRSVESTERPPWAAAGLTCREAEVLALIAAGHTNAEIAEALFISQSTAGVHVSRILTKLGVTNRGQAAAAARRLNLVTAPTSP